MKVWWRPGRDAAFMHPQVEPLPMHLRIERATAVDPDRLYAWWTDFREGSVDHAFLAHIDAKGGARRRILARGEDKLDIEDRGRFLGMPLEEHYTVALHPERREVLLYGGNNFSRFTATYRFEPGKAVLDAYVAPLSVLAVLDPLVAPVVRRFLEKDLEGHLADAARDLDAPA